MTNDFEYFYLDVNPEPWAVGPVTTGRKGNKIFGNIGRNQQLYAYQQAIKEALDDEGVKEFGPYWTGPIELEFWFWRSREEYQTPQARGHRKHEADTTNLQKATEDACQGVLYKNDKDVQVIRSVMVRQSPDIHGQVVVGIRRPSVSYIDSLPDEILGRITEVTE